MLQCHCLWGQIVEFQAVDSDKDALLEVAAVVVDWDSVFTVGESWHEHIEPFVGANLDKDALEFNQIKPDHPFRYAKKEHDALTELTKFVSHHQERTKCSRAIMVGHNTHFDLSFINAAYARCELESPFHRFSVFYNRSSLRGAQNSNPGRPRAHILVTLCIK